MAFRLSEKAARDVIDIYLYGAREFGVPQAEKYHEGLARIFHFLSDNPLAARERTEFSPPVRIHAFGACRDLCDRRSGRSDCPRAGRTTGLGGISVEAGDDARIFRCETRRARSLQIAMRLLSGRPRGSVVRRRRRIKARRTGCAHALRAIYQSAPHVIPTFAKMRMT
jgi:plasmid stabilization system protein ParE